MLNIDSLDSGIVIDHIKAGSSMEIYRYLRLDQLDCCVAIIKNAKSNKYGKKDIIKIEGITEINTDILGFIDHNHGERHQGWSHCGEQGHRPAQ